MSIFVLARTIRSCRSVSAKLKQSFGWHRPSKRITFWVESLSLHLESPKFKKGAAVKMPSHFLWTKFLRLSWKKQLLIQCMRKLSPDGSEWFGIPYLVRFVQMLCWSNWILVAREEVTEFEVFVFCWFVSSTKQLLFVEYLSLFVSLRHPEFFFDSDVLKVQNSSWEDENSYSSHCCIGFYHTKLFLRTVLCGKLLPSYL